MSFDLNLKCLFMYNLENSIILFYIPRSYQYVIISTNKKTSTWIFKCYIRTCLPSYLKTILGKQIFEFRSFITHRFWPHISTSSPVSFRTNIVGSGIASSPIP